MEPCANCTKANVECVYCPPPPRRKRDRDVSGNESQERRVSRKPHEEPDGNDVTQKVSARREQTEPGQSGSGRMIVKDGNSIYLDR